MTQESRAARAGQNHGEVGADHRVLGTRPIGELPQLLEVPSEAAPLIAAFAQARKGTSDLIKITGGRYEVFLTGVGSKPFQKHASQQPGGSSVLDFIETLRERLREVAALNGGVLSEDLVALVGGSEMQVPHVDLVAGQVQVLVALHSTAPTLVFDPTAERPSRQQVCDALGITDGASTARHLEPLFSGGSPLALPLEQLYGGMVPACKAFDAGDAVQIRDGIVHAGPAWKPPKPSPGQRLGHTRVVVFATYSPKTVKQYNVNFQYKPWDWASYREVPAMVAYDRLYEVHSFARSLGMSVLPWTHYEGKSMEACRTLCTTAGLDTESIEGLVQEWRMVGRDPAKRAWVK